MKYFLPEWDDRVDPRYDFILDTYSKEHSDDPYQNDAYIWDIFGVDEVPIDGVLVSRSKLEENKVKLQMIVEQGVHKFLHLPPGFEIMGDCGAFGYIEMDEPPFKTEDTLRYYLKCGFNYGVSIDHLVVPAFEEQKEGRWKITIDNARDMYELWASRDEYMLNLRVLGVAQGWDVSSYRKAARELLNIGYDYIGIGGLARAPTGKIGRPGSSKTVYNVVRGVCYEVRKWCEEHKGKVGIHIFGFARPKLLAEFQRMGVTSFDSASLLRSAWLSGNNYFTSSGDYKSIRVPDPERSPLIKKVRREEAISLKELNSLSIETMQTLRKYDTGDVSIKDTLDVAVKYGELVRAKRKHFEGYEKALADQPWKKCECPICKNIGIEVMIFRGNERNRRRGFHNIYVFYKHFRKISPRVVVFTSCTARKNEAETLMPAYQRYLPSPVFNVFWNNVYDLPVEIKILSAKYGLIDWNEHIPYYDYKMQEADVNRFVIELIRDLERYDKIFFIGLGLYRKAASKVKDQTNLDIEIFPKPELTTRDSLDIIEYTRQMPALRQAVLDLVGHSYTSSELSNAYQAILGEYMKSETITEIE